MKTYFLGVLLSYLLGAIPSGFLVAKARGVDIRKVGSGNIGATNVFRALGKGPGLLTFACDFLKGLLAVMVIAAAANRIAGPVGQGSLPYLRLACGLGALVGHSFSVFLGFRGGKGVATGVGLVMGLGPAVAGIGLGVWLIVFLIGRYVSLASIIAALTVGALVWTPLFEGDPQHIVPVLISAFCLVVVARHHGNIRRLLSGTENRFSFR